MTKRRRAPYVIETTGSAFFDLFEPAEAQRLSIQSGLALALEREIEARTWTQAEAARRIGITQPRVNDLLRGRLTNAWDPAKDEAAGEPCKAYGAAGVMRAPGRLHITWADESTLKIDTEAGTQTRVFHFGPPQAHAEEPSWQGDSLAQWEVAGGGRRGRGAPPQGGSLKAVTTRMRPGFLQKNGVPYGANAVLTEYFSRTAEPNGDTWLILTAIVDDAQYLNVPFIRSTHYKKLPDTPPWEPEPCSAR